MMDTIAKHKENWQQEKVEPALHHAPERQEQFTTTSDIEIERLYLPEEEIANGYLDQLGFPGEYPFTRGVQPT
ncbi:MAG TPA: methylmalonyl-CoA mutase family protein, partial [Anaerolineae bacterium]|nr:methylmalonyl-CoA mutase family protein [Anaerolineae bacterium]